MLLLTSLNFLLNPSCLSAVPNTSMSLEACKATVFAKIEKELSGYPTADFLGLNFIDNIIVDHKHFRTWSYSYFNVLVATARDS